jgi:hypothetical protein
MPTGPTVPRGRRTRLVLAVVGGVLALLCLGGIGITFVLYDDATKIDRGSPDAAVDNYLRAFLVDRDDSQAALFRCKSGGDFARLDAYRADIISRESRYAIGIRVTWSSLTVQGSGGQTLVSADLVRAITDGTERATDTWQFAVVDQDGWRVCGATPVP